MFHRLSSLRSIRVVLTLILLVGCVAGFSALGSAVAPLPALAEPAGLTGVLIPRAYLPLVRRDPWVQPPLLNGDIEGGTWHQSHTGEVFDNITSPEHWISFWDEGLDRPEMGVINFEAPFINPPRIYSGARALKYFGMWRKVDAGIYQQVGAMPGRTYTVTAYAHAWYSQRDDPLHSEWVDPEGNIHRRNDGDYGVEQMVGIDPTGGTDPWSPNIVWGMARIYNEFDKIEVQAEAQAGTITVFLRAVAHYPFKHTDFYWDEVTLTSME